MKFYSEKLNKLFDTEKELLAEEKIAAEAAAKKAEAAKDKKADAAKVEDAFKARNAARREYNTTLIEARKIYNKAIAEARKVFNTSVTEATRVKDEKEEIYNKALSEFTAKHPEGYHVTLKDGDNVVTLSRNGDTSFEDSLIKELDGFLNSWLNILNF